MKIFLLFVTVLVSGVVTAQNSEARIINNADFPVALYSGIPEISIPLFSVNTANSNFSFDLKTENNLYASTSSNFSTGDIGDAWSLNTMANISVTGVKEGYLGSEWYAYDETIYSRALTNQTNEEKSTVYSYSIFGLTGKFVIVKEGTNFYQNL